MSVAWLNRFISIINLIQTAMYKGAMSVTLTAMQRKKYSFEVAFSVCRSTETRLSFFAFFFLSLFLLYSSLAAYHVSSKSRT